MNLVDIKDVLSRLEKVKRTRTGWIASCPVPEHGNGNGDRHPSLSITLSRNGVLFHCFSGCHWQRIRYVLGLDEEGGTPIYISPQMRNFETVRKSVNWSAGIKTCCAALTEAREKRLAEKLGVSPDSLRQLSIGWSEKKLSYTFPVVDPNNAWCGVQLRTLGGFKYCVEGTRAAKGLFTPKHLQGGWLMICEGASDTLTALTLGFDAIGRFSASQSWRTIGDYLEQMHIRRDVVVVADNDRIGNETSERIGLILRSLSKSVRIIYPLKGNDLREWAESGLTQKTLDTVIQTRRTI